MAAKRVDQKAGASVEMSAVWLVVGWAAQKAGMKAAQSVVHSVAQSAALRAGS